MISLQDKYRSREREARILTILKDMEEFGITFDELEARLKEGDIHLRDRILNLRKKAHVKREINGRGKKQAG